MKAKIVFLRTVQILSIAAILMVLSLGFIMPISSVQGFILNPLMFLVLVSSIIIAGTQIDNEQDVAELHQLLTVKHKIQFPCQKAA